MINTYYFPTIVLLDKFKEVSKPRTEQPTVMIIQQKKWECERLRVNEITPHLRKQHIDLIA